MAKPLAVEYKAQIFLGADIVGKAGVVDMPTQPVATVGTHRASHLGCVYKGEATLGFLHMTINDVPVRVKTVEREHLRRFFNGKITNYF